MSFWYKTIRGLVKLYLKTFFKWRITGTKNIPQTGPVVLVSNHISNYDPLVVACVSDRMVHFMAKEELFKFKMIAKLVRSLGAFSIKRGGNDRQAIRKGFKILDEGKVLGIFPEGTRSKDGKIGKGLPGAAMFALKTNATVIPLGISSTYKWFKPIEVKVGNPVTLDSFKQEKITPEDLNQAISYIMNEIKKLV